MNSKILLGVSAILVIAATSYLVLGNRNQEVENKKQLATYDEYLQCMKDNNHIYSCNQFMDPILDEPCRKAEKVLNACELNNKSCVRYSYYYIGAVEDEPLPDYFFECTDACHEYANGNEFLKKNYDIEHYICPYVQN